MISTTQRTTGSYIYIFFQKILFQLKSCYYREKSIFLKLKHTVDIIDIFVKSLILYFLIAFILFCRHWKITDDCRNKYFSNTCFEVIERYMNKMNFVTEFCRKKQHSRKIFHECHIFSLWGITFSVFDRLLLLGTFRRRTKLIWSFLPPFLYFFYVFRICKINWARKEKFTNLIRAIQIFSLLNRAFNSI